MPPGAAGPDPVQPGAVGRGAVQPGGARPGAVRPGAVRLGVALGPSGGGWPDRASLARLVWYCEDLGFAEIWLQDPEQAPLDAAAAALPVSAPDPFVMAAAIAPLARSSVIGVRSKLGRRSVGMLAKLAAGVDAVSEGRLVLALTGASEEEGIEALSALRLLFSGQPVRFSGPSVQLDGARCLPRPLVAGRRGPASPSYGGLPLLWQWLPGATGKSRTGKIRSSDALSALADGWILGASAEDPRGSGESPDLPGDPWALPHPWALPEDHGVSWSRLFLPTRAISAIEAGTAACLARYLHRAGARAGTVIAPLGLPAARPLAQGDLHRLELLAEASAIAP
ncbi:MAG: LLM class flavin-dependent oxidoreductase [Acidimicrobiales bacterium]